MRKKTAVAAPPPDVLTFEVETDDGTHVIEVDPTAEIGNLTPREFLLHQTYIARAGTGDDVDGPDVLAGAGLLVLLNRGLEEKEIHIDADDLLGAVIE